MADNISSVQVQDHDILILEAAKMLFVNNHPGKYWDEATSEQKFFFIRAAAQLDY